MMHLWLVVVCDMTLSGPFVPVESRRNLRGAVVMYEVVNEHRYSCSTAVGRFLTDYGYHKSVVPTRTTTSVCSWLVLDGLTASGWVVVDRVVWIIPIRFLPLNLMYAVDNYTRPSRRQCTDPSRAGDLQRKFIVSRGSDTCIVEPVRLLVGGTWS